MKKVSIIIPCREIDLMTKKCIDECLKLDYPDFEILVLCDEKDEGKFDKKVKVIVSGKVKPAFKRNLGMKKAKGEFFAFIDSDAYPEKDWLKNSMKYFKDEKIGIVGGPNLTPKEGNFWERVSGYVLSNFLTSAFACIRYRVSRNQFVDELPSCNYISRKEISPEYDSSFLTAEDSKFCFDVEKQGYKILYAHDVVVYHHRRDSFGKHVKQMFIYGRDIAWLAKEDFSFDKMYYGVLSLGVIGFFIGLVLSLFSSFFRNIFLSFVLIYVLIILLTSFHKGLITTLVVWFTTIVTHFAYGIGFGYGVLVEKKV